MISSTSQGLYRSSCITSGSADKIGGSSDGLGSKLSSILSYLVLTFRVGDLLYDLLPTFFLILVGDLLPALLPVLLFNLVGDLLGDFDTF